MLLLISLCLSVTDVEKMSVCCDKNMVLNLGDDSQFVIMPHEWTSFFWIALGSIGRGAEGGMKPRPPPFALTT